MMNDRDAADSDWSRWDTFLVVTGVLAFLLCVACGVMGMIS